MAVDRGPWLAVALAPGSLFSARRGWRWRADIAPHQAPQRSVEAGIVRKPLARGENEADDLSPPVAFGGHASPIHP